MRAIKRLAAVMVLALLASIGAPQALAGNMDTPGITGDIQAPGIKGIMDTPAATGDISFPGLDGWMGTGLYAITSFFG